MARAADDAIASQFEDYRFVTAVLAELDLDTGELHYINAGHPPPMLLRRGKAVASLAAGRRLPLGLRDPVHEVAALYLEPGDRLLFFSDGVTEARDSDGNEFGLGRLLDLAERHVAARLPVAETLRRLSHAVLEHQRGVLQDDATLLLVEWARDNHDRNVP